MIDVQVQVVYNLFCFLCWIKQEFVMIYVQVNIVHCLSCYLGWITTGNLLRYMSAE